MLRKLKNLSRDNKQLILYFVDSLALILILLASFSVRLGYWYFPKGDLMWVIFGAPFIAIPIFVRFGLYRTVIRYIEFKAVWRIVQAVSLYALIWGMVAFMAAIDSFPRSVILINLVQSIFVICGLRFAARWLLMSKKLTSNNSQYKKALIYGAGDAGVQLVSALEHSPEYKPVGFIDDSKELQNHQIMGLNIYSAEEISNVINKYKVDEILIAMPSVSRNKRLTIIN